MAGSACAELPGSNTAVLSIVDRILRLTLNDQVITALPAMDIEQLQHRAQEALETLAISRASAERQGSWRPVVAAVPSLCALAVECINVVERAELTTGMARLVAAGCEVLAALLVKTGPGSDVPVESSEDWSYDWVFETLEDLSDQLDFLALEVYCGLGRLEGAINESDALPVVMNPVYDDFGSYWGSIEHRQALQELSAWLLCVVFRAMGYEAVTGQRLMEFANYDALCLCALLRGLLACRPSDTGMPHDANELQRAALLALCGLTAPELAFPYSQSQEAETIEDQNRVLTFYLEVVCSAVVETGLLEASLEACLSYVKHGEAQGAALGGRYLAFLAALVMQAESPLPDALDSNPGDTSSSWSPPKRLRGEVNSRADRLGSLLEAVLADGFTHTTHLRDLAASCAAISAALLDENMSEGGPEDGFTLACRVLLATCLDTPKAGCEEGSERAAVLAALAALASTVGDLEISRSKLTELIGGLAPLEREKALARLRRTDRQRLPLRGGRAKVLELFATELGEAPAPSPEASAPAPRSPVAQAGTAPSSSLFTPPSGLRDVVQNAPKELRCSLDNKLLCDPVISPGGIVFERSTLARWLQKNGGTCPITGQPLSLDECQRSADLRRKVTEWVRGEGRPREARKKRP